MSVMPLLWLDYQRAFPGRHWPGLLLLAAGVLLCGSLLMTSFLLDDEVAATGQQVLRLQREIERRRLFAETGKPVAGAPESALRPASPSAARWDALLGALEGAGDDSVTLLTLDPGVRDLLIAGEARDLGAALDYVTRLQSAAVFAEVYLLKHELLTENPYRPVRFTLRAGWREGVQ